MQSKRDSLPYPELRLFPTEQAAAEALRTFDRHQRRSVSFWIKTFALAVAVSLALQFVVAMLLRRWLVPTWLRTGLAGGLTGAGIVVGLEFVWRRPKRLFLRRELIRLGVPVCLHCAYPLRGLDTPRCPECGRSFDPALLEGRGAEVRTP